MVIIITLLFVTPPHVVLLVTALLTCVLPNPPQIQIAVALAEALGTKDGVNGLPLSLDISWFEQKAVAVLLSLLHLGVKDIRLGPALPAFITPDALKILVDTFGLKPADLKNPEEDLERMLMHGQ